MSDGAYSFSLTTFSPSGKLVQIEYALNAVAAGSTSLGIRGKPARAGCHHVPRRRWRPRRALTPATPPPPVARACAAKNGVVIATEKKAPTILMDETSLQKICMLTPSIGAVYSGMGERTPSALVLARLCPVCPPVCPPRLVASEPRRTPAPACSRAQAPISACSSRRGARQHRLISASTGKRFRRCSWCASWPW
ncbi:hypothetical protein T492DRAFT_8054 [Pavlovales sp. CCMP2436]|nr:hypothetical protein T492DRAFT_8054 [Pavlovales sp. CCMP2436]